MTRHDSMRGWFAYELYQHMKKDKNIWLIVGDLGYKVFDRHREDFPDRFINTGAAEQAMMGIAVGLAMEGKIPVVYSITTFLLYRPFETIRNYIDHEGWGVKLVGSGRNKDYAHDGFSHWSEDAYSFFYKPASIDPVTGELEDEKKEPAFFDNICNDWRTKKEEIPELMEEFLYCAAPHFLSLRR